jgi:hypothetical protein
MSRIHVHIDRLTLPAMPGPDRHALVEALKSELHGILADPATRTDWARPRRTPVLRLQQMPLQQGSAGAKKFGVGVARAIGKGLNP